MSVSESLLIAIFCMTIVFVVLILLFSIIRLFSFAIYTLSGRKKEDNLQDELNSDLTDDEIYSSGKLMLKKVDEPTAAMIMAIVSDESKIPLSELSFKSIKFVERQA